MKIIQTKNAPKAVGPYSQAVKSGNLLFCSGQIGLIPESMKLVEGGVIEETKQIIRNIAAVLHQAGIDIENVIKTTIYLDDIEDFSTVNEVYGKFFLHKPARSTIEVAKLPLGATVEIEVVAECQ